MPSTYNQSFSNFEIDLHADIKKYDLSMSQITMVSNIPIKGVSVASRFMFNSKVMIALLMTASLVMSPIVVADETEDIPTNAIGTGIHDSLVAALSQAGLVSTLSGDGPFTVFAPTDDAFAAAGIDLASFDTDEENATLFDILTYHVVLGQVMSTNLTDGMTATALNGDDLSFTVSADAVTVSGATVTLADVPASNGVIHVIDTVLMPPVPAPVIPEGCDYLVGIDDSGYAFDHTSLEIAVGETVCWIWTDSSMAHNVAETATAEDTTRLVGGLYSGAATSSVDYRVTFDANETFTYICEPHATMNMNGIVVVGTGVEDVVTPTEKEDSDATPGFGGALLVLAVMGAVLVTTQRSKLD